jgi:hypothetical protein
MTQAIFKAYWYPSGGTYFDGQYLDDLQTVNITKGRVNVQDPFKAATTSIGGRDPSDLPAISVGDFLMVEAYPADLSVQYIMFVGRIADVQIEYGIVPAMDRWTILGEDALANAGRLNVTGSWLDGVTTAEAAEDILTGSGVPISIIDPLLAGSSFVSAQTITNGNVLGVLNQLIATEQGRLYGAQNDAIQWLGRDELNQGFPLVRFTDDPQPISIYDQAKYDTLNFASLADNLANKVTVTPEGLAPQTFGSGTKSFEMNSYDQNTSQALSLAAYVQSTLTQASDVPFSISARTSQQSNLALLALATTGPQVGYFVEIELRGTTYSCVINGSTVSSDPSDTRVQLNLFAADLTAFFIIGDDYFGRLQDDGPPAFNNKLGF